MTASQITHAEKFVVHDPEALGFSKQGLAEIDKLMVGNLAKKNMVGGLGLVYRNGKIGYFKMWGDRDRENKQPMTADTIFRIYSMSKPITSVAVMMLVERGKLDLDAPISKYLPELGKRQVLVKVENGKEVLEPAKREITPRDLLRHTSGLTYGFFGNSAIDQKYRAAGVLMSDRTIGDTVKKLGEIPLLYQPGSRWHYSVSTDVLGRLVEVGSGMRFDKYLQQQIFAPLKMVDTSFMVPSEKRSRFAQMYSPGNGDLKVASPFRSIRFVNAQNLFFSGGGGLCSTTSDYLRFCRMMLNGGELDGVRLLKAETVKEMTKNQLSRMAGRPGFQFGLGFRIGKEGEYSWGGAAGTRFWINPTRKLIGIYMIQINPYRGNHGDAMKRLVYEAIPK